MEKLEDEDLRRGIKLHRRGYELVGKGSDMVLHASCGCFAELSLGHSGGELFKIIGELHAEAVNEEVV